MYVVFIHLLTRKCPAHFAIYIRNCPCARSELLTALTRQWKMSLIRCINLFGVSLYLLSPCPSGTSENVLWAETSVVLILRVFILRKMSASAPLYVLNELSTEKSVLYVTKSVSNLDVRNSLSLVEI